MMKKNNWKDTAELIGMAAIVISLGLVAFEVRQNTRAIEQEAAATHAANSIAINHFVAGNEDFSRIVVKSGSEQLSPGERFRLTVFYRGVARHWQYTYFLYRSGSLDQEIWESELRFMGAIMNFNSETWGPYWNIEQRYFTEGFQRLVSEIYREE